MINDQLPGEAIHLYQGDRVKILVRNNIISHSTTHRGAGMGVTVHFHGIRQINSVQADGVPYLTQHIIPPGCSFLYEFDVPDQVGTFFYHAHVGMQEMSIFGPIIIYKSRRSDPSKYRILKDGPFSYHGEHTVMLSEWWHADRGQSEAYYLGSNFTEITEAHSILINGQGIYDPNIDLVAECKGYTILPVEPGKIYRFRVIGATVFRTLGFGIANHTMTVIEVDGDYIKPYDVDYLEVSPDYGISIVRRWAVGVPSSTNGHTIMRYQTNASSFVPWEYDFSTGNSIGTRALSPALYQPTFPANNTIHWYWDKLHPYYGVDPIVNLKPNRTIILRSSEKETKGKTRWYINDVSFVEREDQVILHDILKKTRPLPDIKNRDQNGFDFHLGTYPLEHLEIIDIVVQTTHPVDKPCRSHPWHTHGHSHWEIAHGQGEYVEERDGRTRNIRYPIFKDLTLVYPTADETEYRTKDQKVIGCGWSKLRIIAARIWAMHCHNTPHMYMGMMLALEESPQLIQSRIKTLTE
ncbi:multicopper oxidase-domain-containing protein [Gilbertella persicaria]|uniref:multicopper oxidase-domain-containing protein n=1 Tax=Gilbertella persicaria TaxID=101096 RepID=UPI00221FEBDC|nr:multicopper oxidase-domain-containing protein [Gilbertella persicaria]KAI8076709.1 multicopper oxidase-domain-containing protein [Gilbertella persicaria]